MEQPEFAIPVGWDEQYVVAVWYVLPFCLYLPFDHYEVRIARLNSGRPALIQVGKKTRRREARFAMLPPGQGEMWRDRRGTFRYSSAVVYMPYSDVAEPDLEKMLDFMPSRTYLTYALEYVNRLLRVYRLVTGDYYIPTLAMEDVGHYFGLGIADTKSEPVRAVWTPMGRGEPEVNLLPDKSPDQVCAIRDVLRTEARIPEEEELLMGARDLLDTGSPRLAVVEAQTAFEVVVTRLVAEHYRDEGLSKEQIEKKLECGFKNLLTHHLSPKVIRFCKGMPVHDEYWSRTYVPRCEVVHGDQLDISEEDAEQAIRSVEFALEYLSARPHDRIWPPEQPPLRLA